MLFKALTDLFCIFPAPYFVIHQGKTKIYTSKAHEGHKKGGNVVEMDLEKPLPIYGDVMIEFFNKPKMMKKVRLNPLVVKYDCCKVT